MILFPAIDLKDGQCVRLLRGYMAAATVFNSDPADQAQRFVQAGCEWLHLVDLNGAVEGRPVNKAAVVSILEAVGDVPVQLGGGIRDLKTISLWLEAGVHVEAGDDPDLEHRSAAIRAARGAPRPARCVRRRASGRRRRRRCRKPRAA